MTLPNDRLMDTTEVKQKIVDGDLKQKTGSTLPADSPLCPDFDTMDDYVDLDKTTYVNNGYSLDRCATLGKIEFQAYVNLETVLGALAEIYSFDDTNHLNVSISGDGKIVLYKNNVLELQPDNSWTITALSSSLDGTGIGYSNKGRGVDISTDGSRIVLGRYTATVGGFSNAGRAYSFVKVGGVWTEEFIFEDPSPAENGYFGNVISLSDDGNILVVDMGSQTTAKLSIWEFDGNIWNHVQDILATAVPNYFFTWGFENDARISGDGSRIVVSMPKASYIQSTSNSGAIAIFKHNSSTWEYEITLSDSRVLDNQYFGQGVSISTDGNIILTKAKPLANGLAWAIVFKFNGLTWDQYDIFSVNNIGASGFTGIGLSGDGKTLVLGSAESIISTYSGAIYIYKFDGNNYVLDQKLLPTTEPHRGFGSVIDFSSDATTVASGSTHYNQNIICSV